MQYCADDCKDVALLASNAQSAAIHAANADGENNYAEITQITLHRFKSKHAENKRNVMNR